MPRGILPGWRRLLVSMVGLLLLLGLSPPGAAEAQLRTESTGPQLEEAIAPTAECCLVLLLPVGARSVALGRALTARPGVDGAFTNPAGLAAFEDGHFLLHRTTLAGDATAFSLLLPPSRLGTLGLSYQLIDFGEIETTDELGMTVGTLALRHHLLVASHAIPIIGGLSAGFNYKFYQFRIGCSGRCSEQALRSSAHAADLGLRFAPQRIPALQFGALVSNLGFVAGSDVGEVDDILPARLRLGLAYQVLEQILPESQVSVWLSFELEDSWHDPGSPTPSIGVEMNAEDLVFLRAGYVPGDGAGTGTAVGIGVNYTRFNISVARAFGTPFSENDAEAVQVSIGIAF